LRKENVDKNEINEELLISVSCIQKLIEKEFKNDLMLIEQNLFHKNLYYKGRLDCVTYYKDNLCLIDWKRTEKSKKTLAQLYDGTLHMYCIILFKKKIL
jgi:hypothetical protein